MLRYFNIEEKTSPDGKNIFKIKIIIEIICML
jgi:hypothetical protein